MAPKTAKPFSDIHNFLRLVSQHPSNRLRDYGEKRLGVKTDPNVFPHASFPQPQQQSLAFAARLIQYKHKKYKAKKGIDKAKKRLNFRCFLVYYTYKLHKGGFT